MTPSPQELRDIKMICNLEEPTQWHKRELVRLRLKCNGISVRPINENDELLDIAFEFAKLYFTT